MIGRNLCVTISFYFFGLMWCFVSPLCLAAVIVAKIINTEPFTSDGSLYPDWAQAIGWMIVAATLICIPLFYVISMGKAGLPEFCRKVNTPTSSWGPALPENRTGPRYSKTVLVNPVELDMTGGHYTKRGQIITYAPGEPRGKGTVTHPVPSAAARAGGGRRTR